MNEFSELLEKGKGNTGKSFLKHAAYYGRYM
jgi:hypothetical protein